MEDSAVKRVSFTTISSTVSASAFGSAPSLMASQKLGATGGEKATKGKKSFRISVDLFQPDWNSFPEFNFRKLLEVEKKKHKELKKRSTNGKFPLDMDDDPMAGGLGGGDDDDDVARLAREMEEKYGSGSAYSKGVNKRGAVEHFDKGIGYDENDSFIDNTDAYDEVIPDEIEPNHGGFYINSGPLEFQNRPNFERPEDAERMPKARRKRTLSTSSEEDGPGEKKSTAVAAPGESDPHPKKKKKKKAPKEASAALNGHHHPGDGEKASQKEKKLKPATAMNNNNNNTNKQSKEEPKTTTVKEMLRLKRDNHRNKADTESTDSSSGSGSDDDGGEDEDEAEEDGAEAGEEEQEEEEDDDEDSSEEMEEKDKGSAAAATGKATSNGHPGPAALLQDASKELMQNLVILQESAKLLNGPGENFLTNAASLDILLAIELETQLPSKNPNFRVQVYSYLAERLRCSRDDLMVRADRLRGQAEEAKGRKLLQKLKKTVEGRMAKLLEKYEADCRRVTEMKSTMHVIGFVSESQTQVHMPRRRFHWTDSSRKLLFEVYEAARGNYLSGSEGAGKQQQQNQQQKKRARSLEEHLSEFLKQDVLPLWPTGWMKYEELVKEVEKRRQSVQQQKMIKDVVNSSAWAALEGLDEEEKEGRAEENSKTVENGVAKVVLKPLNGAGVADKMNAVTVTPVQVPVDQTSRQSNSGNAAKQKTQNPVVNQSQQPSQPPQSQQPKKNSYDYSITNLIGNNAATPSESDRSGRSSVGAGSGAGSLKIKSVESLNYSSSQPTATAVPSATVIVSCDDDDDEVEDVEMQDVDRQRVQGIPKNSASQAMGTGGSQGAASVAVRNKRASDSDSSCEIVNVFTDRGGAGGGVNSSNNSRRNGATEESSMGANSRGGSRGGGGGMPGQQQMDANDIDVNQIMQDLKDWQQWESKGNFGAKKGEFAESKYKL